MKRYLYNLMADNGSLTLEQICLQIGIATLLGVVIYISYYCSHAGSIYSKKFNVSLVAMSTLTGTVMTVIGNNIALSLGMVGALSVVRFRTAIKDSRDTIYIFWSVVIGICCGVGDYPVAIVGSGAAFIILLLFGRIKNDNRMLLVIRGGREHENDIESKVYGYFRSKALLRVKNTTRDSLELIYEIPSGYFRKTEKQERSITEVLYEIDSVEYANVVAQNDELGE